MQIAILIVFAALLFVMYLARDSGFPPWNPSSSRRMPRGWIIYIAIAAACAVGIALLICT